MISLSLESPTYGTLDLDALVHGAEEGSQAQPGLTGLGLPPVDVQWSSGSGDGSTYRGRRALPRPLDVPIQFMSDSRENLISQLDNAALIIDATDLVLRAVDDELGWNYWVRVVRTGGGDYAIGQDTDGVYHLAMLVTIQAGYPFWTAETAETITWKAANLGTPSIVTNPGNADTYPIWTIDGPIAKVLIAHEDGRSISWDGFVNKDEQLIIDAGAGLVTDTHDANRYGQLGDFPSFFPLHPGDNTVTVTGDISSPDFTLAANSGVLNHIANPSLTNDGAGWSLATFARDATKKALLFSSKYIEVSPIDNDGTPAAYNPNIGAHATYTVSDLTINQSYEFSFDYVFYDTTGTTTVPTPKPPSGSHGNIPVHGSAYAPIVANVYSGPVLIASVEGENFVNNGGVARLRVPFIAPSATVTVEVIPQRVTYIEFISNPATPPSYFRGWWFVGTRLDRFSLTLPGLDYFDGDTPDTAELQYSWLGVAGSSQSRRVSPSAIDTSTTAITCSFKPRKRMVA